MIYGILRFIALAGLLAATSLGGGCGKASDPAGGTPTQSEIQNPKSEILKLHWLGKKQLAADTNATPVLDIWKLPESIRLETQTLDKLATAPWRLWAGAATPLSNAPSTLLRPLLDDLVQEETYLEIQSRPAGHPEIVLAVRLPADRAALWQTNLPVILASLSVRGEGQGEVPVDSTAAPQPSTLNPQLSIARTNDWTIVTLTPGPQPSTLNSQLLPLVLTRLATHGTPHEPRPTNHWIEIAGNLRPLSHALKLGWETMTNLPAINLRISGDGQNVHTTGELSFTGIITSANLPSWRVPTNLVVEPLVGLTMVRSLGPVLRDIGVISADAAKRVPPQLFSWQRSGPPLQLHVATEILPASEYWVTNNLSSYVNWLNARLNPAKFGQIITNQGFPNYRWDGLTLAAPYFRVVSNQTLPPFYHLGFGLLPAKVIPAPAELHDFAVADEKTIFFEWEHTGSTLPHWRYLDDASRMTLDTAHIARLQSGLATIEWLKHNLTNLSHCVTQWRIKPPGSLTFTRKSTIGFNGLELAILAHWLETPNFPADFYTLWQTNPVPYSLRRSQ